MVPAIATKFVAALRSGAYQQCRSALHPTTNQFCYYGVLAELHRLETGQGEWKGPAYLELTTMQKDAFAPPTAVLEWSRGIKGSRRIRPIRLTMEEVTLVHESISKLKAAESPWLSDSAVALSVLNDLGVPFHVLATITENHAAEL